MAEYSLSDSKGFIVKRSEVDGRLDPYYNYYLKNIQLKSIFEEESLYKISKPFSGGTPSKNNPEYWEGDIPWVSPKDFKGLYLDESEDHISEKGLQNSSTKLVPAYSVLLVVRSGILIHSLPVTINTVPVTINQDLKAFVINDDRILPEYLGIYFYVFGRKLLPLITKHSTTVQSINTEQFAKLKIPIPDKPIQQRIIALLNTALSNKLQKEKDARDLLNGIDDYLLKALGITLPQRQSDLQSRIFTTWFSEVTGSRFDPKPYESFTKKLRDAITKSQYMSVPLRSLITSSKAGDWGNDDSDNHDEKYSRCIVIRATEFDNVYNLKLDNSRAKFRLIEKKKLEKLDIKPNDILIEKSGGSPDQPVGRVALITKELFVANELCYSNFIHKISVDTEKIYPEYLFYFLKTIHSIGLTEAMQSQTNGIRNLIMSNYFEQQIVIPIDENGEIDMEKQISLAKEIKDLKQKANALEQKATSIIDEAKTEIEKLILG